MTRQILRRKPVIKRMCAEYLPTKTRKHYCHKEGDPIIPALYSNI
jgi:hypothetical protein